MNDFLAKPFRRVERITGLDWVPRREPAGEVAAPSVRQGRRERGHTGY